MTMRCIVDVDIVVHNTTTLVPKTPTDATGRKHRHKICFWAHQTCLFLCLCLEWMYNEHIHAANVCPRFVLG